MGLISFVMLFAITAVYLNNYIPNKPEFVKTIIGKINENMDQFIKWAGLYAVAATLISLIGLGFNGLGVFKLLANIMILVMLAPALFAKYSIIIKAKAGDKAFATAERVIAILKQQEKYIGYAGAVFCIMLFMAI